MNNQTWTIILIFLILTIAGILAVRILDLYQENRCQIACGNSTLGIQVIPNGEWNLNDLCLCYNQDSTKSFRLGQ